MRILYAISDILFFFIYYIIGYRKKVVSKNISFAFPEKTTKEKDKIAKKFFKHFTDLFVETIKGLTISEKNILKRYKFKNAELLNNYIKKDKSIALIGSHQANWEWSVCMPLVLDCNVYGAYTILGNKYFDKMVKESREKFGFVCYKSSNTVKAIHRNYSNKIKGVYLLLSDQSPMVSKSVYWKEFFNIKVPVHTGAELLAKRFDLVVINITTKKIKRGYYETEFLLITDQPKDVEKYSITDTYIKLTEETIKIQPECYLWSHNRFKHHHKFKI
jgi:KDO2-lipid IV(A) lauroyltransferase